jgi:plasmid stabilization system protein ParE
MLEVVLSETAKNELESAYEWWATNRSRDKADQWYNGFLMEMLRLERSPERYAVASERMTNSLWRFGNSIMGSAANQLIAQFSQSKQTVSSFSAFVILLRSCWIRRMTDRAANHT